MNETPFNNAFYTFLEYHLCRVFENSGDEVFSRFWCDGVLMPHNEWELSFKHVNDTRQIITEGYIGPTGQDRYTMVIKLGRKSLSRYLRGLGLEMCVPDADSMDWVPIEENEKRIELNFK